MKPFIDDAVSAFKLANPDRTVVRRGERWYVLKEEYQEVWDNLESCYDYDNGPPDDYRRLLEDHNIWELIS